MTPRHFFPKHGINVSFQLNKHVIHFQLNNGKAAQSAEGDSCKECFRGGVSILYFLKSAERHLSQPDDLELIWRVEGFLIGLEVLFVFFCFYNTGQHGLIPL